MPEMTPPDNWELANWIAERLRERYLDLDDRAFQLDLLDNEATVVVWVGDQEIIDISVTDIPRLRARRRRAS